jgi:hypothetical protein
MEFLKGVVIWFFIILGLGLCICIPGIGWGIIVIAAICVIVNNF